MENKNRIQLSLNIINFNCSADDITELVKVQPTETWKVGDPIGKTLLKRKQNMWLLSSGIIEESSFDEHVKSLLKKIKPNLDNFVKVGLLYPVELSCAVYIYGDNGESTPWIHFDKESLSIFNKVSAEVDFDLYVLPVD